MHATNLLRSIRLIGVNLGGAARGALACTALTGALLGALPAAYAAVASPERWTKLKARSSIERSIARVSAGERIAAPTEVTNERRLLSQGMQPASLGDNKAAVDKGAQRKANTRKGDQVGMASYYWQPQALASGGRFNPNALTAAHKTLPFGTRVRIKHLGNGRSVDVHINDRGPYVGGRIIDLSKAAAAQIGMTGQGIARVSMTVLGR